ncbi:MAG: sigma-E processing peptidase SpoIIGA [Firmicutes bacterium]|nr:sigma-E processing peptidase SpoIIGA [Bacillota bacterium]
MSAQGGTRSSKGRGIGRRGEGRTIARATTVVLIDVFVLQLAANFLFDYLLLWATAAVTRTPTSRRRLSGAALLGTGYFFLYSVAEAGVVPYYGILRFPPVVLLVSLLMVAVAFRPLRARRMAMVAAHFYGVGFAAAGAGMAASFLAGDPARPDGLAGFLAACGAILIIAELGWGVVQRRIWQQLYQVPLEIRFGDSVHRVEALVDTGNRLRDPLSGSPVTVIEGASLRSLLPDYLQPAVEKLEQGDLTPVTRLLASERWSSRFRVIPYASIGREHGLMVGFRPDEVRIVVDGGAVPVGPCILGLCKGPLDPEGAYQALVHPELVQHATAARAADVPAPNLLAGRARTGDVTPDSQV